ncbi:MAG: hypothetical protein ACP5IT_11790 [Thermoproteota archaeon]
MRCSFSMPPVYFVDFNATSLKISKEKERLERLEEKNEEAEEIREKSLRKRS